MTIDWGHFTPLKSILGGLLIGSAAGLLMLFNGRVAGVSGILAGAMTGARGERLWRMLFLLGLLTSGWCLPMWGLPLQVDSASPPAGARHYATLVAAGLLVGLGTRYAGGCPSGHGVCGLANGSRRSLLAVLTFMLTGILTLTLLGPIHP